MNNTPTPNTFTQNQNFWTRLIVIISVVVPVLVTILFYVSPPNFSVGFNLKILPKLHACINFSVSVLLLLSFYYIKNKNIKAHKTCNLIALILSAFFLVSYVTYHTLTEPTKYGGEGALKYIYYFLLLTHIVLAAVILPLILFTFLRALAGNFPKHKKLARYTFPLWLYVSVTGVLVYLLISPYYN